MGISCVLMLLVDFAYFSDLVYFNFDVSFAVVIATIYAGAGLRINQLYHNAFSLHKLVSLLCNSRK
jgi:hypothetical protein